MTKEEIEQNAAAYIAAKTGQPWQWRFGNQLPWYDSRDLTIEKALYERSLCRPKPPKPEPQVIPWTLETKPMGAVMVKHKTGKCEAMIMGWTKEGAWIDGFLNPYKELIEDYTLQDGSPCGQVIKP